MRRLVLAAAVATLSAPALLSVAEELTALFTGKWSAPDDGASATAHRAAPAARLALADENGRWRDATPADVADALRSADAAANPPVLLVHGLDEPGSIWLELAPTLETAGRTPIRIAFRNDASVHAAAASVRAALAQLVEQGVANVDIVAHSMGGLVVWDALAPRTIETNASDSQHQALQARATPAVGRLILIASPVHGAPLAHLRAFAEAREQVVRALSPSLDFAPLAFLRDGAGEASLDLAPDSPLLRQLRARGAPDAQWVGVITATLAPHSAASRPDAIAWLIGDGAVPTFACVPSWADEVRVVRGAHRFILKSLLPSSGAPSSPLPAAIPVVLEMLTMNARPGPGTPTTAGEPG